MSDWKLHGTENPRTGEVTTWIKRDGRDIDLEHVVDELNRQEEEIAKLNAVIRLHRKVRRKA